MKRENCPGAAFQILIVCEPGQLVCCFISKADGIISFDPFEFAAGVACGLILHRGDLLAALCPLRFHNAYGGSVDEEGIVHLACAGWKLPHSHTYGREQIQVFHVLNHPAGLDQLLVYCKTGLFLWRHHSSLPVSAIYSIITDKTSGYKALFHCFLPSRGRAAHYSGRPSLGAVRLCIEVSILSQAY